MSKQIIIVGAGIVGLCHAFACVQRGFHVTVLEQGNNWEKSCSHYAGGMLAPYCELESAEPLIANLGAYSMKILPGWLKSFSQDVFFQQSGSLVVAHPRDQGELVRLQQRVRSTDLQHGMQECDFRLLEELEPYLEGRFRKGLFFPHEGQISPRDLLPALAESIRHAGGIVRFGSKVSAVQPYNVVCNGEQLRADWVMDCRGIVAKDSLDELRGVKGEMVLVQTDEVRLGRPIRMMHPRYPIYIVPRPKGVFMIGATSLENESRYTATVRSTLELLSAAYALHPSFGEATILELNADSRPALPNHHPCVRETPGLLQINGFYRHGYLLSPAVADSVGQYLQSQIVPERVREIWERVT